ncbi:DUF3800 domain-containing protein [Sulfolobus sp. S-194]|uniref:DUF3800 domain-containing protein n=1 Tax=Sulfolobus sp. S-194 TaxID=2512240 RepID=UPI001436F823|nr:DUF3800 domain-containing protein [Sulfolobus sp. S-194]QIW24486.1 DUF3800 domain-containing protein [Sulfolobus sp. S-194]
MYLVYIDESRRDYENRVVLGGIVIYEKYIQHVNSIFANVILNEISSIIDKHMISSDDLTIHMKDFVNEKDTLRKLLRRIGIKHSQIVEIKRRIIFNIARELSGMKKEEVFAAAARVEKRLTLNLKYKLAFKFILERIAMNVKYDEPILVVFDTPGKDFKASEIYETYRK